MPILLVLLEAWIVALGVWVLSFVAALYWHLSVQDLRLLFLLVLVAVLGACARPWIRRLRRVTRGGARFAGGVLALGLLLGLLVLVSSRPDADDVGFIGPALLDAATPSEPFTVDSFRFHFHGRRVSVPFLSENEAWEALVVTVATPLGLDPLSAYHNHFALLATLMWTITYALLFRRFRMPRGSVLLAVLLAAVFLLLDGNLHRSFGNFSLLRIWQGKVLAWAVLGPAFLWLTLRVLARPSPSRYALILTVGLVGFFVNRSTLLLFPILAVAAAAAYLLAFGRQRRRRLRVLAPVVLASPLLILGLAIAVVALPEGQSPQALLSEIARTQTTGGDEQTHLVKLYGATWSKALFEMVIGSTAVLVRDAVLLLALPLLVVPRPQRRFLPLFAGTVVLLAMSPLTGPVLHHFTTNAYWRLYFLLPLPLCAGLVAFLVRPGARRSTIRSPWRRALVGASVVTVVGVALERPTLSSANGVSLKRPLEYRLPAAPLQFTRSVAPRLDGQVVLAPNEISTVLALTEVPQVQLVYTRISSPGSREQKANGLAATCLANRPRVKALASLVREYDVDAVVIARCTPESLVDLARRMRRLTSYRLEEDPEEAVGIYRLFWVHENPQHEKPQREKSSGTHARNRRGT